MSKTKDVMQGHYQNHLVMDNKGNLISRKKRVNDTKIIEELLSSKSKLKLTLKQYRFLMMMRTKENCSEKQREWLKQLYKIQHKLN